MKKMSDDMNKVAVIGLGYVGLPLAVEFGKIMPTIGFDLNENRVKELNNGLDQTFEIESHELKTAKSLQITSDLADISTADVYVITVPTPIDRHNNPDLNPLISASKMVGSCLSKGNLVIYESTVFPGCTEEVCVPILEEISGLKFNVDFECGYSPERINPGDKQHRLPDIKKVTSGSTAQAANFVDQLYGKIIRAGTHKAESIRVAEAAKVIENTQRDLNIALINELAIIFNKLGIDTHAVLEAAGSKWNFLPFKPGLVGGHCIGVDPYYLTHKAQEIGYNPEVILAGRRLNDKMSQYVATQLVKSLIAKDINVNRSKCLVLGLSFKENCPDIRNTKVADVILELKNYGINVDVYDPWVNPKDALEEYNLCMIESPKLKHYDSIILAVAHSDFVELGVSEIAKFAKNDCVFFDLKGVFQKDQSDIRL